MESAGLTPGFYRNGIVGKCHNYSDIQGSAQSYLEAARVAFGDLSATLN